ncbi:MAG: NUDIX hydrolase [Bacilli bacterium]|nr:NUDIX hydrolase [Bacilli bacterium]
MKTIIYNEENLNEKDVTKYSKRVKLLVENSKGEILIIDTKNNAFFIGGHIEGDESDLDCLIREIREEGGVDFIPIITDPFFEIKYIYRDGEDVKLHLAHYYAMKTDGLIPDESNLDLTSEEATGEFHPVYVSKSEIIQFVEDRMKVAKRPIVARDTLDALKVYLGE